MVDLSIIIVSYKSKDHLAVLLPSVLESRGVGFVGEDSGLPIKAASGCPYTAEVIVVDNGSNDGTLNFLEEFKKTSIDSGRNLSLSFIKNQNTGFSAGNNLGIKQ